MRFMFGALNMNMQLVARNSECVLSHCFHLPCLCSSRLVLSCIVNGISHQVDGRWIRTLIGLPCSVSRVGACKT